MSPLLKQHGYRKRALTWHKPCSDTILVFHAEKNRWGAAGYGVMIGVLSDELFNFSLVLAVLFVG